MEYFSLTFFAAILLVLLKMQKGQASLSRRTLVGLVLGSLFGVFLQLIFGQSDMRADVLAWVGLVGSGYIAFLKMVVVPLVLVSMIAAVVKLDRNGSFGKISAVTLTFLLGTTAIAALVAIAVTHLTGLEGTWLLGNGDAIAQSGQFDPSRHQSKLAQLNLPNLLLSFIPVNPFADLAGLRDTSVIAVVIFGVLVGIAARNVSIEKPEFAQGIYRAVDIAQSIVMRLVKMIMALTPFGIASLMSTLVANLKFADILNLFHFIAASYLAIGVMFLVHGLFVALAGTSAIDYFKKIFPVLVFAFSSRSSAATIPLNIETQINQLRVSPGIANLSASLGATIGQNGCAGIYPAMLAMMVAPTVGINPFEAQFIVSLVVMVVISSFGIAGVGGGATFAALIVLPALGLPIAIVGLLISIEPLIDMARTALNVSGAMAAGTVTQRLVGPQIAPAVEQKAQ
ncbi:MAG: cation:dicarboxylate symporter family transporter [Vibrionaceae bacterium]